MASQKTGNHVVRPSSVYCCVVVLVVSTTVIGLQTWDAPVLAESNDRWPILLPWVVSPRESSIDATPSPTRSTLIIESTTTPVYEFDPPSLVYGNCKVGMKKYVGGKLTWTESTFYNEHSKRRERFLDRNGDGITESRSVYHYRNNLQVANSLLEDVHGRILSTSTHHYDSENRLTRTSRDTNGDGSSDEFSVYTYDEKGRLGIARLPGRIIYYYYDRDGYVSLEETDLFSDGRIDVKSKYVWNGPLLHQEWSNLGDSGGLALTAEYTYSEGRLVEVDDIIGQWQLSYTPSGSISDVLLYKHGILESEFHYIYDQNNRLVEQYASDVVGWTERVVYSNDCSG